jgi:hypothetical protein
MSDSAGPSLAARVLAVIVLAIAAWVILKVVIGILTFVVWVVVAVAAVVGIAWAVRTLSS